LKSCSFGVPVIATSKSATQLFANPTVLVQELSFAPMSCDGTNTVHELLYPENVWAGKQICKAEKSFMDGGKIYYKVDQDIECYVKEPLSIDERVSIYHSYDQNYNSVCLSIHEEFADGSACVLYYNDGPMHHVLSDGDHWQSASLVYEEDRWVLDISCQNTVSSNWIVKINEQETPCIELTVFAVPYRGNPPKEGLPEFVNKYYFNADGLCVLLRRYMGPVWEEWRNAFWQKIKGNPSIKENGEQFYLYCDYISENFL